MSNRIFIDSSILVEYHKGAKRTFYRALLSDTRFVLSISQTVVSEYLFHHLGITGGKSPLTLKVNKAVSATLRSNDPLPFLEVLEWLPDSPAMLDLSLQYMQSYNLLPNDALILASCKLHGIRALASFDPDFGMACRAAGITLLRDEQDFEIFRATAS